MSTVVIKECGDYSVERIIGTLNEGIKPLGGWEKFISPGMKVLLKVNLIGPKTPESAAVTHCELVRALTRILKSKRCTVWIGDSAGGAIAGVAPTEESFRVSGLKKVAEEEGAEIKNFDREGVVEVASSSGYLDRMYLAKPIFEADFVINVPKLKTHTAGIYTGAVKNVFGLIPGLRKAEYHKAAPDPLAFGKILVDIHRACSIGLHIMDGITAMQGEGPTAGEPYNSGKILMSTDPLALDVTASAMIGLKIDDIPILKEAADTRLGECEPDNISLLGDYNAPPELKNFKLPQRYLTGARRNYKVLINVIDFLKTRPRINQKTCRNCNKCVESCPVKAIDKISKVINYKECIECMCCHELCMFKAVELKNVNMVAGAMNKVMKNFKKRF